MAKHHRQDRTWEQPLSLEDTTLAVSLFDKEFVSVTLSADATLTDVEVKPPRLTNHVRTFEGCPTTRSAISNYA
jgi:hypothetical protein